MPSRINTVALRRREYSRKGSRNFACAANRDKKGVGSSSVEEIRDRCFTGEAELQEADHSATARMTAAAFNDTTVIVVDIAP